ncbi:unnamed protein product [Symbiodinium sp. CCMP2592]|nr:unnamed protein product [Symbiodinium sp. CCMP2592]
MRSCLADAVPIVERRWLPSAGGIPLGLWNLYGSKMELDTPSTIFKILAEEVLGYHVNSDVQDVGTAAEALWKLAGCSPSETDSCHEQTDFHITFGVTFNANVSVEYDRVQRLQMGGLLENLASMGYLTRAGIYVTQALLQSAETSTSRSLLDDYRSYDARYHQPQSFFDDVESIDHSQLVPCAGWLTSSQAALCENNWWKAPTCRFKGNGSCVPCLTATVGRTAYRVAEIMDKAVAHSMPIALGVTRSVKDLHDLVAVHRTLFVFWEPDVTFLQLHPRRISFPKHNPLLWLRGDYSTDSQAEDPRIVVSSDLMMHAPDVREMLLKMKWSLADIDAMMQDGVETKALADGQIQPNFGEMLEVQLSSGNWISGAAWEGACNWLHTHEHIWRTWIPQADSCLHGQGLFSVADTQWLERRQVGAVCRPCEPGYTSVMVTDETGLDTAVCRLCSPGRKQSSFSAQSCAECPAGTISQSFGQTECTKCPIGSFQNGTGRSECIQCPENMDTSIKGATTEDACICSDNTYWQWEQQRCIGCPADFICNGSFMPPLQRAGTWAEALEGGGYSIYYCRDVLRCPEALPGSCATGRTGRACADCFKGFAAAADGSCQPCDALQLWPFILIPLVVIAVVPLLVFAGIVLSRARKVAISVFVVCLVFGQLVVCLQSLEAQLLSNTFPPYRRLPVSEAPTNAIYQFDILWVDPAKAILQSLSIFSFDIEFSCVLPPRNHLMEYTMQLLAYPVVLLGTFLVWSMARFTRRRVSFTYFVNFHGIILIALLTAMSLSVLRPFQCRENPNGTSTIVTKTDVICWTTGEHIALILLACVGILAYPVAILAAISFLTWKYPIWLRSSSGLEVLERYRFLFGRFRPERYYYGLMLSFHNLVVALIPATLVSVPALQVGIMGIVVCVKLTTQSLLWPWRVDVANYNDMVLSAGLLMLLLLASPLLNLNEQKAMEFVAVLLACVMFLLPIAALLAASAAVCFRLRPQSKYSMFLCHHKAGAGALCRFIKLIVHKYGRMNIFLDSDELDDLSRIFEIVSSDTRCLVAVLTPDLLQRMWCAGEMTSARKSGIPIIPLYCDGFAFPDADCINKIESVWTEEQQYTLTSHGISMEDIKAILQGFL